MATFSTHFFQQYTSTHSFPQTHTKKGGIFEKSRANNSKKTWRAATLRLARPCCPAVRPDMEALPSPRAFPLLSYPHKPQMSLTFMLLLVFSNLNDAKWQVVGSVRSSNHSAIIKSERFFLALQREQTDLVQFCFKDL